VDRIVINDAVLEAIGAADAAIAVEETESRGEQSGVLQCGTRVKRRTNGRTFLLKRTSSGKFFGKQQLQQEKSAEYGSGLHSLLRPVNLAKKLRSQHRKYKVA